MEVNKTLADADKMDAIGMGVEEPSIIDVKIEKLTDQIIASQEREISRLVKLKDNQESVIETNKAKITSLKVKISDKKTKLFRQKKILMDQETNEESEAKKTILELKATISTLKETIKSQEH